MFQDVFNVFHIRLNSKKITGGVYFKTKVILSRKGCISKKLNKKVSYFLRMVGCSDAYQRSSKLQLGPHGTPADALIIQYPHLKCILLTQSGLSFQIYAWYTGQVY